ncbi:MAG: ligase-associated DNA damage response exonuclease [Betaproteobacteria bacterium]|nr:ligase-associated DNA damage response exonuclease [Betaproteobacteria bacterium]
MNDDLVVLRPEGLYCPAGRFHIDPWRPVPRAVITHAHADHARPGHDAYLATAVSAGVLRARLGDITLQGLAYGEAVEIDGVRISLHPAGHVLGSAQVRLEHRGQVWVASGDYYLRGEDDADADADPNPTCAPFEPVRCHCFITESTFGLPIYRWRPAAEVLREVDAWWRANAEAGRASLLLAYSFGKAQRVLAGVDASIGPVFVHGAVQPLNDAYRAAGVALPETRALPELRERRAGRAATELGRALVVAPPSALGSAWARTLGGFSDGFASGWMQLRGARRRQGVDRGFVLSDHADWPGLQRAIAATGAERVIVTHGYEAVMVRWLAGRGLRAESLRTEYGDDRVEGDDAGAADAALRPPVPAA